MIALLLACTADPIEDTSTADTALPSTERPAAQAVWDAATTQQTLSSLLAFTSFLAFMPLKPAWILVAASSTSRPSQSMSSDMASFSLSSVLASSFLYAISFLVWCPLKPAWILVAASATSGSSRSMSTTSSSSFAALSVPVCLLFSTSCLAFIPLNPA